MQKNKIDFSPNGPLTTWVKLLMFKFKIDQFTAIITLGKCKWENPPLETIDLTKKG